MKPQIDPRNPSYDYTAMTTNTAFRDACALAKVEPTRRQYRKWLHGVGAARLAVKAK